MWIFSCRDKSWPFQLQKLRFWINSAFSGEFLVVEEEKTYCSDQEALCIETLQWNKQFEKQNASDIYFKCNWWLPIAQHWCSLQKVTKVDWMAEPWSGSARRITRVTSCKKWIQPSLITYLILVSTASTGGGVLFSSRRTFFHREHGRYCFRKVYSGNITHKIPYTPNKKTKYTNQTLPVAQRTQALLL